MLGNPIINQIEHILNFLLLHQVEDCFEVLEEDFFGLVVSPFQWRERALFILFYLETERKYFNEKKTPPTK